MNDQTSRSIAANVRAAVAIAQVRQTALADLLGLSQPAVSRRLSGRTPFTAAELHALADHLNTPITRFYEQQVAS